MKATHPLRTYRQKRKLRQAELAAQLGVTGMTVSRWERGVRMPKPSDWPRITEVTKVTPAQLAEFVSSGSEQSEAVQ